jgi:hypothetical protein
VVGVGRAADLEPDAVPDLRGLHAVAQVWRARSDKLGAGLALFGMANVPFIYVSVNYWRTFHPPRRSCRPCRWRWAFPWYCVTAFTLLFIVLLRLRARLEHQRARVEALYLARMNCDDAVANALVVYCWLAWFAVRPTAAATGVRAGQGCAAGEQIPAMPLLGAAYGFIWVECSATSGQSPAD